MTLNRLVSPLLIMGLLPSVILLGCQTINEDSNQSITPTVPIVPKVAKISEPIDNDIIIMGPVIGSSESWRFPELPVSSLNRYDWQLVRQIDSQGSVSQVDTQQPLMLEVRPSNLVFKYDCQRYRLHHDDYSNNSYSAHNYSSYGVTSLTPDSCSISDTQAASDISKYLTELFPRYGRGGFSLELLSSPKAPSSLDELKPQKPEPYELAINTQDKKLVFVGTLRALQPTQGLPISYEFLKRYKWRLVSAVYSENQPIIELSRPGFPVIAYFGYPMYNDEHQAGFSSDCNGVGGPYILTPDNVLLIGSGLQSMMGCGPKREAAEDKIRALEQLSKSQLTLKQLPNPNVDDPSLPYYLLTQKLDTGETLIWKNSEAGTR